LSSKKIASEEKIVCLSADVIELVISARVQFGLPLERKGEKKMRYAFEEEESEETDETEDETEEDDEW
jgi:hypothetical protein